MSHRDWTMAAFNEFFKKVKFPQGAKVIDIGCRDQALKGVFKVYGIGWEGVDKEGGDSILKGHMENMNMISDNIYDLVFSCHSFEHCEKPISALKEFKRILKPNGYLFMSTPFPCEHQILRADKDHIMCLNLMQIERLLDYVGFKLVKIYVQFNDDREQNNNIITIGRK